MDIHFNVVSDIFIEQLQALLGEGNVMIDELALDKYGRDKTEDYLYKPEVVVIPENTQQVSDVMRFCNEHLLAVTVRGGGTGLSGSALPMRGGVVMSMEKLNRLLEIDEQNLQATVEPGLTTEAFQTILQQKGLFYPPDPSSKGTCYLGGNVSQNAGGPKAVKYGVTRDYVLNLEVVLPSGEIIWTGANVLKYATGYNLTHLMVGSEGTLGVITKIVFKLRAYPPQDVTMLVPFESAVKACEAITAIFMAGLNPSAMEFIDRLSADITLPYLQKIGSPMALTGTENAAAYLFVEFDGHDLDALTQEAEKALLVFERFTSMEVLFAASSKEKEGLWLLRRNISPAVNAHSLSKSEDIVVPRKQLPLLMDGIYKIADKYGFKAVCYGHAGDGNVHLNVMKEALTDEAWKHDVIKGIEEVFVLVVTLGGTLSGEHGIGMAKRPFMHLAIKPANIALMKGIKAAFDPNGILNPDKIF